MAKYKVPVYIETVASQYIGEVECDDLEDFYEKANDLWESKDYDSPSINIHNDFDLHDWDIPEETDHFLESYKIEEGH